MGVPLHKHYPSDDTFREDAIQRMADRYAQNNEVAELLTEILDASGPLLRLLGQQKFGWADYEVTTFAQRLRALDKALDAEIEELRRLDNASLTP